MAFDLADTPRSDILVQASGDAHLSNFGLFASPERTLVFDTNDFDETLPGPWEWDVKRLAASVVIAGRANGFSAAAEPCGRDGGRPRAIASGWPATPACACSTSGTPRITEPTSARRPRRPAAHGAAPGPPAARTWTRIFTKARRRDGMRAFESLTGVVDGRRVLLEDPPVLTHVDDEAPGVAREGLRGLPGDDAREPARLPRAVPVRRHRPQGGRRRQRRHPLLRHRARGPGRERPADPPGEGGDGVGHGAVPRGEPSRQPRPARGRRPAAHAGDPRHLPGLDPGSRRPRLLPPPAVGHEGLRGHHDPPAARLELLRRASAAGRWPGRTPARGTPRRSPPTSGRATRSTGRSPTSPRPTPT